MNEGMIEKIAREIGCDGRKVQDIVAAAFRELHLICATDDAVTTGALLACLHNFGTEACYHLGGILTYHDDKTNDPESSSDSLVPETMLRLLGRAQGIEEIKTKWFRQLDTERRAKGLK